MKTASVVSPLYRGAVLGRVYQHKLLDVLDSNDLKWDIHHIESICTIELEGRQD